MGTDARHYVKRKSKLMISIKLLSSELRKPCVRGGEKSIRAREDGGRQEKKSPLDQLRKECMSSQRLEQQAQGLHGSASVPLCI